MPNCLKFCVALFCLMVVAAICIAPELDLPDTLLRARQLAFLLLLAFATLNSVARGRRINPFPGSKIALCRLKVPQVPWFLPDPERDRVRRC